MLSTQLTRTAQMLALAAVVAVLCAPAVALGGSTKVAATPDWLERYANAHPYNATQTPDLIERYAAAHPFGDAPASTLADGRSPDTLDAAAGAAVKMIDGRSPDTLDAAQTVQPIEIVSAGGFDWLDAGIGAGLGAALLALLGACVIALASHRRQRVRAA